MLARPTSSFNRRYRALLAIGWFGSSIFAGNVLAQSSAPALQPTTTSSEVVLVDTPPPGTPAAPAPQATPAATAEGGLQLLAPGNAPAAESRLSTDEAANSTLEMRVARRPWLLEKLTKPKPAPSVKMNPPKPPKELPDPPSMSRFTPRQAPTQSVPHSDLPLQLNPSDPDAGTPPAYVESKTPTANPFAGDEPISSPSAPAEAQRILRPKANNAAPSTSSAATEARSTNALRDPDTPDELADVAVEPEHVADEVTDEAISIRRPRIGRDGSPSEAEQEPARVTDGMAQSDVPDRTESTEAAAPVEPSIPLDYAGYPKQKIKLTNTAYRMRNTIRQTLAYHYSRPEVAHERSNWGMLHSIMVYGIDTKVLVGRKRYSSIAWIAGNNACRGQRLFTDESGSITARSGVGLQGHQAQLLAIFSLCGVPRDYPVFAGDTEFSIQDLIKSEQLACKSGEELTFTLIGLSHYLDTDSQWQDSAGQTWNFERLIREELAQPIVGAACGGTHRLMGYAHALRKRRAEGKPITGQWKRAEVYTRDFTSYVYRLQNRDGSFSTDWFEGREDNGDMDRKIQTTGHMVEWLLTITPDSQLQNPRLVSAIRYLANTMYKERGHDWKIGPKGHALRSLAMFYERVYQSGPAWQTRSMARTHAQSRR